MKKLLLALGIIMALAIPAHSAVNVMSYSEITPVAADDTVYVIDNGTSDGRATIQACIDAAALDGDKITNDTIDDDSIDFTDVTLADFTDDISNTVDTEWDTLAEINAASTDTDAILDTDIGSTVQAYDAQLADIADGTLTGNFINTANPWADNEVSDTLTASIVSDADKGEIDISSGVWTVEATHSGSAHHTIYSTAVADVATADDYLKNDANDSTSFDITMGSLITTGTGTFPIGVVLNDETTGNIIVSNNTSFYAVNPSGDVDVDSSGAFTIADSVTVTGWVLGTSTATSLSSPTFISSTGSISFDNDHLATTGSGTFQTALEVAGFKVRAKETKGFTMESPTTDDDDVPIWNQIPVDITITGMNCNIMPITGTSVQVTLKDQDGNALDQLLCVPNGVKDDGSIANASFSADESIYYDTGTVSGSVDWLNYFFEYSID